MGKNPIARSGVFNRRIVLAIILCSVGVSLALLASAVPVASNGTVTAAMPLGSTMITPADFTARSAVTITEFSDFQCPYCQQAAVVVEQLRQIYGNNVKFVFKQMPLPFHQYAFKAAQAAVIAQRQGKFWKYHDRLFAAHDLSPDALKKMAAEVGLKEEEFSQALDSAPARALVEKDIEDARQLGVRGTPTFFVNGKIVRGAATLTTLTRAIDRALTRPAGEAMLETLAANDDSSCEDSGGTRQVNLPTLIKVAFTQERQAAASPTTGGPTLSINDVSLVEDSCQGKSFVFTVTLSKLANKPVAVTYGTSDGVPNEITAAAVANKDYVPVSGTLSFTHDTAIEGPKGTYLLKITVPLGNYVVSTGTNDGRAFTVTLSGATNATISRSQGIGTLLDAALSCMPAQNAGCFVNFCGATTACKNVNRSATVVSWCKLAGTNGPPDPDFNACNAAGLWLDSDGDGFSDAAEAQSYIDVNANGVYDPGVDVPLPGADPNKPDVYLHYDYFYASDHSHNPPAQAIQWIVDAFAAHGVNLHIDPQHNAINESVAKVVTLRTLVPVTACTGPSAITMHQLRQTYLPPNFKLAYHYMVFSHWSSCDSAFDCGNCPADPECGGGSPPPFGSFGSAEILGDDAIVSFGKFVDAGRPIPANAVAGVAMHELGHNLGLFHGGGNCDNFKPNYLSVMNFNFYTTGIPVGAAPGDTVPKPCVTDADCTAGAHCSSASSGFPNTCFRIDYSSAQLLDLNETALDETKGLNGSPTSTDISTFTTDGITPIYVPTNGTPIDWNQNGAIETNVTQDINGDGATTLLTGFNDWANLHFDFQCSNNFQD